MCDRLIAFIFDLLFAEPIKTVPESAAAVQSRVMSASLQVSVVNYEIKEMLLFYKDITFPLVETAVPGVRTHCTQYPIQ